MKKTSNLRTNTKKISKKKTKQRKKLGQIFLKDENTLKKIVSLIAEKETDFILEIGAGSGALTEKLLKLDKPVLAVEIDLNWATVLKKKFENHKNFTLIVGDILEIYSNLTSKKYSPFTKKPVWLEIYPIKSLLLCFSISKLFFFIFKTIESTLGTGWKKFFGTSRIFSKQKNNSPKTAKSQSFLQIFFCLL